MKNKTCFLCKSGIGNLIRKTINGKERNVHPFCYNDRVCRNSFFELLFGEIDFPKLDKDTSIIINKLGKKYGFDVMLHALKIKQKAIIDNKSKGYRYFLAILSKQVPFSEKEIERTEREKLNKPKIIEESNMEEINFSIPKRENIIEEKEIEF